MKWIGIKVVEYHTAYSEFVYSFLGWVGFEDDDDEEDEGKSGGSGNRK